MTDLVLLLGSIAVLLFSAFLSLALRKQPKLAAFTACSGNIIAAAMGLSAVATSNFNSSFSVPWSVPGGQFHIALDPVSALFLVPLFILCACGALYGVRYGGYDGKTGYGFFLYNMLAASLAVVFTARNAVLFLAAWEIMTLSSFLLVVLDYKNAESRAAGWLYLIATHIGTACIIALFGLAWHIGGSAEFSAFPTALAKLPFAAVAFLAVVGFGTKAGFFPLHVWLPKAHPAAPSHVSAVMSGIMIKAGIYGLVRTLMLAGDIPLWFGVVLAAIGVVSGILGVLFALAQHDLKSLLAYHSVENIGIIALGLGVGYMGVAAGRPEIAFVGFAGGFLHVVNHAFFKGLLFLGAGSVQHATGLRDMDKLGGLFKAMPVTAITFVIGAAAISGLPPFNGFVSEFMIYTGAFRLMMSGGEAGLAGLAVLTALALIGGLAAACFAKAFGMIFLGVRRTELAHEPHESPALMAWPMLVLAALCVFIGVLPQVGAKIAIAPAMLLSGSSYGGLPAALAPVGLIAACVILVCVIIWCARNILLSGRKVGSEGTWGCGYTAATPKIQYTASSFAQPIVDMFGLGTAKHIKHPQGLFPTGAGFHSHTPDMAKARLFGPVFEQIETRLSSLRVIQHGNVQAYILYIAAALTVILVWTVI